MELSEKIKQLRKEKCLTLEQVGDYVGVGKSTVRKWESGLIKNMRRDKIARLAEILGTTPDYLMGWTATEQKPRGVKIPVYGTIVAGIPVEAIQDIIDYEEIDAEMANGAKYIALQVKGNSMEPTMYAGDVVIIRLQPTIESGQIAAVMTNGDDATLKKVILHTNGLSLIAANPAYAPMNFSAKEIESLPVTIIGRAVEIRRKL